MADLRAMVLKLVERRTMAYTPKQFVESFAERARRVIAAQGAKCRIKLAKCGMRKMRFGCITQFEMMQVAKRNVELAQLGGRFGFADLSARQM